MHSSHAPWPPPRPGFLAALVDFHLTTFVSLRVLKLVYAVAAALVVVAGALVLGHGVVQGGRTGALTLVLAPVGTLVLLVLARVLVELVAVLFRIGEDVSAIARRPASGPPPVRPYAPLEY